MAKAKLKDGADKNTFILMAAGGDRPSTIEEKLGISRPTFLRYRQLYAKEIEEMKKSLNPNPEPEPEPPKDDKRTAPIHSKEKKDEKPQKPKFASIENETTRKTIIKASDSISTIKAQEIKDDYQAAQVMHSASVRYKENVEYMGVPWNQFLAYAIDEAYKDVVDAYKEAVEKALNEQSVLEMEIEAKMSNPEPKVEDGMKVEVPEEEEDE